MGHRPVGILLVIKHNMSNNGVDTELYTKQGEGEENGGQTVKGINKPYIGEASNICPWISRVRGA